MVTLIIIITSETMFLFQRLSIALQKGNAVAFQSTFDTE